MPPDNGADELPEWEDFPTDLFPGVLRDYIAAAAESLNCDTSFVALPLLSATAAAIGSTRRILLKQGWTEPAILWTTVVSKSGTAKSSAHDKGIDPVKVQERLVRKGHARREANYIAEHEEWKAAKRQGEDDPGPEPEPPIKPAYWLDDITLEALAEKLEENERGVLVCPEELASWFNSFGQYKNGRGGDRDKWLCLNGGRELKINRKTAERKEISIEHASVSLCGTIQPETLSRHMTAENRESGLLARFLMAMPPDRPRTWTDDEVPGCTTKRLADLFHYLYHLDLETTSEGWRRPGWIPLEANARELFVSFVNDNEEERFASDGDDAAILGKMNGFAARIALVFYLAKMASGELSPRVPDRIDQYSMASGIRLAQWFGHEARRIHASLDAGTDARRRADVLGWIKTRDGTATPRDLQTRFRSRFPTSGEAERELRDYEGRGLGTITVRQSERGGGRPSLVFSMAGFRDR